MKRFIPLIWVSLFFLTHCAVEKVYVGPPPFGKRLIILPHESQDPTLKPYVVNGVRYYPIPRSEGFTQVGNASWYGKAFHGRPTASGEIFDMNKVSAAHKILPLGTYVQVTNLSNKKKVVVRINDRGPFVKDRIIDLSRAAARKIEILGAGVVKVRLVALGKEVGSVKSPLGAKPVVEISDLDEGVFTVQVGAFKSRMNALVLADRLKVLFAHVEVTVYEDNERGVLHRVRVSRSLSLKKASEVERKLEGMGFDEAFIVSL